MNDKDKKQGLYLLLVATAIIIPLIIGISYAYFVANISGSSSTLSGTAVTSMSFSLDMTNNSYVNATNILPIDDYTVNDEASSGTFSIVAGANPYPIVFSLSLTDITIPTELKTADFKWMVTCVTDGENYDIASGSFENYTSGDLEMATNIPINANTTEDYEIRFWVSNTNNNQVDILNKSFSAKVKASGEFVTTRIPSTYQEVEWLGSSGTQYIKSGVMTNGILKQSTEIQPSRISARQLSGSDYGWYFGVNADNYYENSAVSTGIMPSLDSFDHLAMITNYTGSTRTLYVNGSSSISTASIASSSLNKEIYIYRLNASTAYYVTAKIKSFKISSNGNLSRYLIPCYRKSDSVAGFYDLVNGGFYTNQGSGTFSVGNDV